MKRIINSEKFNIVWSLCAIVMMWAVWMIAAATVNDSAYIPPFSESAAEFFTLLSKSFFWKALSHTLLRTLITFLISFVLAAGCACLGTVVKGFAAFMRPVSAVFRTLPTMAVLLLIWSWFAPRTAPVAVAFLVMFPMIYSQISAGIDGVDKGLLEMAKAYNLTAGKKIKNIYLPHIAPQTVEYTGNNLSFCIKIIISAEVMASTRTAIGGAMSEAQLYNNFPRLAALTLWAVAIGLFIEFIFRLVAKKTFKWTGGGKL